MNPFGNFFFFAIEWQWIDLFNPNDVLKLNRECSVEFECRIQKKINLMINIWNFRPIYSLETHLVQWIYSKCSRIFGVFVSSFNFSSFHFKIDIEINFSIFRLPLEQTKITNSPQITKRIYGQNKILPLLRAEIMEFPAKWKNHITIKWIYQISRERERKRKIKHSQLFS